MATHFSILALRTPWTAWKDKKNIYIYTYIYLYIYKTLKDELSRLVGGQHATGQEWRNNSIMNKEAENKQKQQLWMWLVIEVKPHAVKNNIA